MSPSPLAAVSPRADLTSVCVAPDLTARAIIAAAAQILTIIEHGEAVRAPALRTAMESAFGASGAWDWKCAYEAGEVAQLMFLRKYGPAMRAQTPAATLSMLDKVTALFPVQSRRSETSQALQQFSTPLGLGFVASVAAGLTPNDVVLEPSAGTGLLAGFANMVGSTLILNELADMRAGLLGALFPASPVSQHDAAHIHDHLDAATSPSVVLMNPPFSVLAGWTCNGFVPVTYLIMPPWPRMRAG